MKTKREREVTDDKKERKRGGRRRRGVIPNANIRPH